MDCKDRSGNIIKNQNIKQEDTIKKLYGSKFGRFLLKIITKPFISKIGGFFLNRRISTLGIKSFINNNHINMKEYENKKYKSYNDFFTRKIKPHLRPVDKDPEHLISPCDSKLTVHQINSDSIFTIKDSEYTLESLFQSEDLAKSFEGGTLLLFRLSVDDYHRYCYIDSGTKSENFEIPGKLHTVNPIALGYYPIYKENSRSYSILKSDNFDYLLMMEVGALMVGKIVNYHGVKKVEKGEEKGRFEFGGSTIIICLQKDTAIIDEDIIKNSKEGYETKVEYGSKIGIKMN